MRAWMVVLVVTLAGCTGAPEALPDDASTDEVAAPAPEPVAQAPAAETVPEPAPASPRIVTVNGTVVNQCHLHLVVAGGTTGADTPCQPRLALEGDEISLRVEIPAGTQGALLEWRSQGAAAAVVFDATFSRETVLGDYEGYAAHTLDAAALRDMETLHVWVDHADMVEHEDVDARWGQDTRAEAWVTLFLDEAPRDPLAHCRLC